LFVIAQNPLCIFKFHQKCTGQVFDFSNGLYTFINPYSYLFARKRLSLFSCFDIIFFDGFLIVKLASIFGIIQSERISFDMTSLAPPFLKYSASEGKSVYFIGSTANDINKTIDIFIKNFPLLRIVGYRDGYFNNSFDFDHTLAEIYNLNPDIVIAGLGTPLQEQFLVDLKSIGWNGVGITCGGFFHQTAKKGIQYYPYWINKLHLRWAFRMYDEPKLIKRYLFQYPQFIFLFSFDAIRYHLNKILSR